MDYSDVRIIVRDLAPKRGTGVLGWSLWVLSLGLTLVVLVGGACWVLGRAAWAAFRGPAARRPVGQPPEARAGEWTYARQT